MKGNWKKINLISLANYINGFAFKPSDWDKEGVPIIRIEQINGGEPKDFYNGSIPENNRIYNGNLIFSWSATLKVVIWNRGFGYLNQHLFKVIPKKDTEKYFLKHLLDYNMIALGNQSQGSTMKHIKRSELDTFNVQIPKKRYQQKIAKILNTVDAVIEKTEQAITKYQAINKGMTHDLFTRGIDLKTRQLRPSYKDAPELYKKSTLGMIPKDWEVEIFEDITLKVTDRDHFTPTYFEDGVPIISPKDFDENEQISFAKCKYISLKAHLHNRKKTDLEVGDLVFTRIGAGLGKVCLVEPWMPEFSILHSASMIRVNKEKMLTTFLMEYIKSYFLQRQIKVEVQSIGVPDLGLDKIKEFKSLVPKSNEQRKIIKKVESINSIIKKEIDSLKKHQNIKKGLMQDLLTAKVEVTV